MTARLRGPAGTAMSRLSELVLAHLEEEDRSVVPLLAVHVTAEEQRKSMARSRAKIPQADELRVLAMMLAAADEDERARMLAPLPDVVVTAWTEHEAPALSRVHRVLADVAVRHPKGKAMTPSRSNRPTNHPPRHPRVDEVGSSRRRVRRAVLVGASPDSASWSPASR